MPNCLRYLNIIIISIIGIFTLLCNNAAYAQGEDLANAIIPQQQKFLDMEQQNREIDEFKEWEKKAEKENKELPESDKESDKSCFKIKDIILEGNTILSKSDISEITNQHYSACISIKNISEVINKLNTLYTDKGYITTQVYIKQQNIKSGILILTVIEGKVEDVNFGNNKPSDKLTNYFITPINKGDILNIKAIDQTTENLNYIPSYQYKAIIEPGSKPGLSKININGNRTFPIASYIETDTIGQEYTGHNRYTLGSRFDNPLKLGDSLNLKYISTYNDKSDGKYSKSFITSWSMPISWARVGINSAYSSYLSTINGHNESFQSSGKLNNNSFFIQETIFRNKMVKTNLISSLNLLGSKNYINDAFSQTQSRNLSNFELGIMNNLYTRFGGFFHKLTYIRGLSNFGSQKDLPNSTYHAQFNAIRFYQLYNLKVNKIWGYKIPFLFQNIIDSQYTNKDVYAQNQFVLGGFYSVRGFRDVNIFASNGMLTRNDIDFNLIDYIKPNNAFAKLLTNNGQGGLTLGAFFDIGYATSHSKNTTTASGTGAGTFTSGDHGTLAGAGYKLGYISKYFQSTLTVGHSLKYPSYLEQSVKANDGRVFYLSVRGVW